MRCIDETLAAERAPDADARIRIYVTGFGWNNCSVPYLKVNTIDLDALRKRFYSEFERKFKSKLVCSE